MKKFFCLISFAFSFLASCNPVSSPTSTSTPFPFSTPQPTNALTSTNIPTSELTAADKGLPTQDPNVTIVKLTLVTGDDGTANLPVFELFDNSGGDFFGQVLFSTSLNQKGDLQPNQTAIYEFTVPSPFCKIAGWHLSKPANSGVDDPWLLKEIYIELNGEMVYFDRVFYDQGPMNAGEGERSGNWVRTNEYKQQCGS